MRRANEPGTIEALNDGGADGRSRLASLGHQERCSRGDWVAALSGAQRGVRRRKNGAKRGTSFLQGLKPIESPRFTSALKHRPPEEKDFFRSPRSVCATKGA